MTVYVVFFNDPEYDIFQAVFSTRDKAQSYVRTYDCPEWYEIREVELDKEPE